MARSDRGNGMNFKRCASVFLMTFAAHQAAVAAERAPATKETTVLQRVPVAGTNREMAMGIAEFPPNAEKPRHMATGPELCYVLEGAVTVTVDGRPPKVVRAGETFRLPAYVMHVTTAGPAGAKVLATWARDPAKAFNIPASN